MITTNRINIILVLVAIFFLILGTNRIDKRHFETAQDALTSVYNDRVLAQDYIYKMNNLVHEKRIQFINGNTSSSPDTNREIQVHIDLYSDTELTRTERETFKNFKDDFEKLKIKESNYFKKVNDLSGSFSSSSSELQKPVIENLKSLQTDLDNLALVQVTESKNVMRNAQKSLDVNKFISNMEIYALLVIGIIILFVIFYRIKKSSPNIGE